MLKKVLSKSGLRILKAIKKLSTKRKTKSSQIEVKKDDEITLENRTWRFDHEAVSLSWSLASLDTKSIDTYLTLVSDENGTGNNCYTDEDDNNDKKCCCCCCCCVEYETENQRNENRENEMFV